MDGNGVRYVELPIDARLAPYVRLVWSLEADRAAAFGAAERIFPDGIFEVIFHYGTPFDMRFDGEPFKAHPTIAVVSQGQRFVEIRPSGPSGFISVRFQPWGFYHFLGLPLVEFADRLTPADAMWGQEVRMLRDELHTTQSMPHRSRLIQDFLVAKLRRHGKESVEGLVRGVWSRRERSRIGPLCRELGVTERRLERTFAAALGVTPKQFIRLTRFLRACRLIRHGHQPTLAQAAHEAGYYDQAHCIAEFRAFAGMTPRALAAAEKVAFLEID